MLVGKIKKEIRKAIAELIQEGIVAEIVNEAIKNTEIAFDPKSKEIRVRFKKEI